MENVLVVCYSYSGVSRRAAQLLASHHGWPLAEIHDPQPRGILRCVLDSLLRRHPEIRYDGPHPGEFRTVALVSPIWAYRLAGPMRSFVANYRPALKRVAVISVMGGAGASNAVAEVGHILGRPPVVAEAFTNASIDDGSGTGRLLAVGDTLEAGTVVPPSAMPLHVEAVPGKP